jgi:FixJ family two-component response regulator
VASKVVRRLAGARSEARRGSAMQIAGNRGDMRCQSDSRQRQILDLVLAGHPSKNIAADLGISQRSVDTIARQ